MQPAVRWLGATLCVFCAMLSDSAQQSAQQMPDSVSVLELQQQLAQLQHQLAAKTAELEKVQAEMQQLQRSLTISKAQHQEAEAKLGYILKAPAIAISHVCVHRDRRVETICLSAGFEAISGYSVQELQPNPELWMSRIHPDDLQRVVIPSFAQVFAETTCTLEYRFYHKDGSERWMTTTQTSVWDDVADCWRVTGVFSDSTDRNQLAGELSRVETRLSDILDGAVVAATCFRIFDDRSTRYEYCSAACELVFGYKPEEFLKDSNLWLSRVHPDDRFLAVQFWQQFFTGTTVDREYRFFHRDGSMRWVASKLAVRRDHADSCWVITTVDTDITDRKRTEIALQKLNQDLEHAVQERTAKLREQHAELEAIFRAFPDLLFKIAADGTHLAYKSQGTYGLYCSPEEFLGRRIQDVLPAPVGHQVFAAIQECLQSNTIVHLDYTLLIQGNPEYFEARLVPYLPDQVLQIVRNVSKRKRAEVALRQSEELFRQLFEEAPIAITLIHPTTGQFLRFNNTLCQMTGYTPSELATMTISDLTHPDDIASDFAGLRTMLAGETSPFQLEKRYIHKQGHAVWVHLTACLVHDQAGRPCYSLGMLRDITERKHAEAELVRNRDLFQAMFEESADAIFLVDPTTMLISNCNQRAVELFEVEDRSVLVGVYGPTLHKHPLTPEQADTLFVQTEKQGHTQLEVEYVTHKGRSFWGSLAVKLIVVGGRQMRLVRVTDISDRKKADAQLRASLQEKEVLLKEIHHRVKNNMQVISSLLRMQARRSSDWQAICALQEAQHRVQSIALLHEQLYQSPDLSQIDIQQYICNLVHTLLQSYSTCPEQVRVAIDTGNIKLNLTTAIPCSLIINELVSNALKHAFPDNQPGEISITIHQEAVLSPAVDLTSSQQPQRQGVLTVRDSGIGMPAHLLSQPANSLGLQIVQSLVEQLHGTLSIHGVAGTVVQIVFPYPEETA